MLLAYYLTNRDILSPWFISCTMYTISITVVALNNSSWNIKISQETILTIFLALIFFGFGELIVRYVEQAKFRSKIKQEGIYIPNGGNPINIPVFTIVLVSVFMLGVLYWYFKETYRLSIIGGNPGGYEFMLKFARSASTSHGINFILTLLLAFCNSIAYFFVFIIAFNISFFGKKTKWKIYVIPITIYLMQSVLTTGRQIFIQFITTGIFITFVLIKKKGKWNVKNTKLVFRGITTLIIFLFTFFALGFLTNKSLLGFSTTISIYAGSSIAGLNHFFQQPILKSEFFGGNTLFGIYSSLGQLGVDIPKLYAPLNFFFVGSHGVNIYTPLVRYITDFGYIGMLIIQFFLGVIYGAGLMILKRKKYIGLGLIIYAMLFYPIVESAIEERFFMLVFSLNAAFKVVGVIAIYKIFIKKNRKMITLP
jgi:oligosaccharide repeat unit polymerase